MKSGHSTLGKCGYADGGGVDDSAAKAATKKAGSQGSELESAYDDIERSNYKSMRGKGFGDFESRYHATNPPGRLFSKETLDPWKVPGAPPEEDPEP